MPIKTYLFHISARQIPLIQEAALLVSHLRQVRQRHGPGGDRPVVNSLRPLRDLFRGVEHHAVGRDRRGGMVRIYRMAIIAALDDYLPDLRK